MVAFWYPSVKAKLLFRRVRSEFTHVRITSSRGEVEIRPILYDEMGASFQYRYTRYALNGSPEGQRWEPVEFEYRRPMDELRANYERGMDSSDVGESRALYGPCNIEIPMKSVAKILVSEVLNPFYLFQVWSVILWYFSDYEAYATCILVISIITVTAQTVETRQNLARL